MILNRLTIGWMAATLVACAVASPAMAQIGLPSTLPSLPSSLTDRIPQKGTLEGLARDLAGASESDRRVTVDPPALRRRRHRQCRRCGGGW